MSTENKNIIDRVTSWFRNSVTFKIISIAILALLMLIPSSMVDGLIRERKYRHQDATREIMDKWSNDQFIIGPVLSIPYKRYSFDKEGKKTTYIQQAVFLPEKLNMESKVDPKSRKRGIYEAILYQSTIQMRGYFDRPDFSQWKILDEDILWDDAKINLGITDLRGVEEEISFKMNDVTYRMQPGVAENVSFQSGVSTVVQVKDSSLSDQFSFELALNLKGSQKLMFYPIGATTELTMESNWPDPSFTGKFIPDSHNITKDGFEANWKILQLNRNYPQQWLNKAYTFSDSEFGLVFDEGVDQYQKNERSSKYAFMLIALSFLIFFFSEVMNRKRIHPIQYLLVGFALVIFYVLLLSLSEHMLFGTAYSIAAVAVIGLVTIYVKAFVGSNKFTLLLSSTLSMIYLFVFIILQLESYALLAGSIGLFLVLAMVMWFTRKIDWYAVSSGKDDEKLE